MHYTYILQYFFLPEYRCSLLANSNLDSSPFFLLLFFQMKFHKKLSAISLGQGQGPRAEAMMRQGMDRGRWVFFQNCHLSPSWMPALERLIEQIDADKVNLLNDY